MVMLYTSLTNALPLSLDPTGNVTVSGPLYIPTECQGSHHVLCCAAHSPIVSLASETIASYKDAFKVCSSYPIVKHLWRPLHRISVQRQKSLKAAVVRILSPQEL